MSIARCNQIQIRDEPESNWIPSDNAVARYSLFPVPYSLPSYHPARVQ
jgi:hypothetical protein